MVGLFLLGIVFFSCRVCGVAVWLALVCGYYFSVEYFLNLHRITFMKMLVFLSVGITLGLSSCHTIAGVGNDISESGKALETVADKSGKAIQKATHPKGYQQDADAQKAQIPAKTTQV